MTDQQPAEVIITDVKIPFGSMVVLILKFVVASIPAALLLTFLGVLAMSMFSAFITAAAR
jgi:hypothetical protein